MNKKYSIHNKKNTKSNLHVDKVYKKTKGIKIYLTTIFSFVILVFGILVSPVIMGNTYDYSTVQLNDPLSVTGSLNLKVSELKLNKDKGIVKIVLNQKDDTGVKSLSNIKYDYKINYISNQSDNLNIKIEKLSDEYTVLYVEGVPKNFGVLSVNIKPSYVYPELEPNNDLKNSEIKFYAVESEITQDLKLKIENISVLKQDDFNYQIKNVQAAIKENQNKVKNFELSNKINLEEIEKLQADLDYQTLDEQIETKTKINSKQTEIETNNTNKSEAIEQNKQLEDKINQLKKKLNTYD